MARDQCRTVPHEALSGIVITPLRAVVVQRARRGRACDAGDRAQIFVDCPEVVVSHVLVRGPRHYLEQVAAERKRKAVRGYGSGTRRMEMIKVCTMSHDFDKL